MIAIAILMLFTSPLFCEEEYQYSESYEEQESGGIDRVSKARFVWPLVSEEFRVAAESFLKGQVWVGTPENLRTLNDPRFALAIRRLCIDEELMEEKGAAIYFRGAFENERDLVSMRRDWLEFEDAPKTADRDRFAPFFAAAGEARRSFRAETARLNAAKLLWPDHQRRFEDELELLRWHEEMWSDVESVRYNNYPRATRLTLRSLRDRLTPEEWANGWIPAYEWKH